MICFDPSEKRITNREIHHGKLYLCNSMERETLILHLAELGTFIDSVLAEKPNPRFSMERYDEMNKVIRTEIHRNGWFDEVSVRASLKGIRSWMHADAMSALIEPYSFRAFNPSLALILAGNLPLVGFHDVLCGLLSGYRLQVKMSSEDKTLLPVFVNVLSEIDPIYTQLITLNPPRLSGYDAVIGTGSDSTLLHLIAYFRDKPHLLRGNRTSVAVLDGNETDETLGKLAEDIFRYYGRGCRNVTHLIVPKGYSFDRFFSALYPHKEVVQNKKYGNNYEYNRAVFLLSQQPVLENGFVLLVESESLHPPLATLYYHAYSTEEEVTRYLSDHSEQIQCVVGRGDTPFGSTQCPEISDFADNINTLSFLAVAHN